MRDLSSGPRAHRTISFAVGLLTVFQLTEEGEVFSSCSLSLMVWTLTDWFVSLVLFFKLMMHCTALGCTSFSLLISCIDSICYYQMIEDNCHVMFFNLPKKKKTNFYLFLVSYNFSYKVFWFSASVSQA